MNQVVRLGDRLVRRGVLAMVLFVLSLVLWGQQQKTQDQSVPDAPTPQEPDSLGRITSGMTPGKGAQETPPDQGTNTTQVPPSSAASRRARTRCSKSHPKFPRRRNTKGPVGLSHHGQLRHCSGDRTGQETSTSGRLDLAGFPNITRTANGKRLLFSAPTPFRSPLPWSSTRACPGTP